MKNNYSITLLIIGVIMAGIFALSNNITLAQTNSTTGTNVTSYDGPFILFTQIWGGDFPVTQTFVYDSYSKMSVGVFGNNITVNKPLSDQIAEIKGDIQQSGIQS